MFKLPLKSKRKKYSTIGFLNQHPLYFNGSSTGQRTMCAYGESAFEELDETFIL